MWSLVLAAIFFCFLNCGTRSIRLFYMPPPAPAQSPSLNPTLKSGVCDPPPPPPSPPTFGPSRGTVDVVSLLGLKVHSLHAHAGISNQFVTQVSVTRWPRRYPVLSYKDKERLHPDSTHRRCVRHLFSQSTCNSTAGVCSDLSQWWSGRSIGAYEPGCSTPPSVSVGITSR